MTSLMGLPLPTLTEENRHFWTGGETNRLLILRCGACGHWLHPPGPTCPSCLNMTLLPKAVSGLAIVASFTVNRQRWLPNLDVPYILAIVELPEQKGLRLTTRLIDCDVDEVAIGQHVEVVFVRNEDVWLPLFRPSRGG